MADIYPTNMEHYAMNTRKVLVAAAAALTVASAQTVLAGGFALAEVSARGNALQGAIVGSTRDASAIFFNPANMTELGDNTQAMAGFTLLRPDYYTYVGPNKIDQDEKVYVAPHLYVSGKVADGLYLGFGEYSEFGLGTKYEGGKNWPLSFDSTRTEITSFTLSPTIAWQATEALSLGAGLRAVYFDVTMDRYLPPSVMPPGTIFHMAADDWAYSYLLSAAYQVTDAVRVGVVYRGETKIEAEGDAELVQFGVKGGAKGDITMPQSVMAGINWQATEKLNLGFTATWTDWTSYDVLNVKFDRFPIPASSSEKGWEETWRFSVGAEYQVNENWAVQLGLTHDESPVPHATSDTVCPPGDRDQIGLGFSYGKDNWKISADYMYVYIHSTDRSIMGYPCNVREARTDTVGLTYSYNF